MKTFVKEKSHVFNNEVFIGGIEYAPQNKTSKTYEDLEKISNDSNRITSYNVCYTKLLRKAII